ncbi:hypothetical protein [Synechococcus sp. N26]|uniref:hypothetical protein n=1 Tax=Synechococcus sp. N26 TaxID=2575513 RepID=UPI000E0FDB1D|nr:hypothetical protein [Synechococcus sp. N26]
MSSGTWKERVDGEGTWIGKNGYQGFFQYQFTSSGYNYGNVYLDVDNNGAFVQEIDIRIGGYISPDVDSGEGVQSGFFSGFSGEDYGFAHSPGFEETAFFKLEAPLKFSTTASVDITKNWLREYGRHFLTESQNVINLVKASTWEAEVKISAVIQVDSSGQIGQGKQIEKGDFLLPEGSAISGSEDDDTLRGLAGWDLISSGSGNDLIHGGNGRDIIDGGSGSDELHGDFGWNTFKSQQDSIKDLIAIKSDQHLSNWWYGKAGNSPNGEKADFIEGLDAVDEIKIIGVFTSDISVADNVTARGVTGIGIYAKGTLEAVYTGGNLSTSQIQNMTTGDGSTTAMNNQIWSYWGDNTVPALQV